MPTSRNFSTSQKGFAGIFGVIALVIVLLVAILLGKNWFNPNSHSGSEKLDNQEQSKVVQTEPTSQEKINPYNSNEERISSSAYLGVPCAGNPNPKFTHDLTEVDKILKITPNSLIASKSQDRAFLWIDESKTAKVPIYAPVDADLIRGVYKMRITEGKETIDYDLHFQVSCEIWFFINHISDPSDKIKKFFPKTPAANTTSDNITQISPPIHFSAGELIGYTTGTAQAHNFDFAVFGLNHTNNLIGQGGSTDTRFKNFICPFDLFPENLKSNYYKKLDPSLISQSNCK